MGKIKQALIGWQERERLGDYCYGCPDYNDGCHKYPCMKALAAEEAKAKASKGGTCPDCEGMKITGCPSCTEAKAGVTLRNSKSLKGGTGE